MGLIEILYLKDTKALEKRAQIVEAVYGGSIDIDQIREQSANLDDKKIAIVLEALEEVTRSKPDISTIEWLRFAAQYIEAQSNNLKRESSRIVGNIAHLFENDLTISIQKLLQNTNNEGTVVRWSSAYALAKIIVLPQFACCPLFDQLTEICEREANNGVKNQYIKSLNKAAKLRKKT